eukprot:TRINITY_DN9594_c0_g1_i1.p1 TRINITY_DN9594_c0_g1~~TRINITY_DN9594_c0_g1_i1.p1  ORF type:complete len:457 (+),score=89.91 TRINITY_DN9594_c0_g1_i1:112-1371(+)
MEAYKVNVLIVGASGRALGVGMTENFLRNGSYRVKILTNAKSIKDKNKSKIFEDFERRGAEIAVAELSNLSDLVESMKGIEIVISLVSGNSLELVLDGQLNLIEASKRAGVRRFVTSDYGMELSKIKKGEIPYYDPKIQVQQALESQHELEYTFFATNAFGEAVLSSYFCLDVKNRKIISFGPNDVKISAVFSEDIVKVVPRALLLPETKNARVQLEAFTFSFEELQETAERISGQKFDRVWQSEEELRREYESKTDRARNDVGPLIKLVYARGDGYFASPLNRIHPALADIRLPSLEDRIRSVFTQNVYKILNGVPAPSDVVDMTDLDRKDGYMHLSTKDQLVSTIAKYYADQQQITVYKVDFSAIAKNVKWEQAARGVFPHLYGELKSTFVSDAKTFERPPDKRWESVLSDAIKWIS